MRYLRLFVLGVMAAGAVFGQKKEDFQALQRDVALGQADVAATRKAIEDKLEALTTLVQQSIEASGKTTAALAALEQRISERLAEQQKTLTAPLAEMGAKVSAMTDELQFVRETAASSDSKLAKLNAQLADVQNAIRVIQAPPPPPETVGGPTAASQGPPPGTSADQLYNDARRDESAGKFDIAMEEFQNYLKWFPTTDYAANAQFYIGNILLKQKNYEEAIKAFDMVLEKYPSNTNKSGDAMYMKGLALSQSGNKAAAAEEFRAFLKKYPRHDLASKAQAELKSAASAPAPKKTR